MLISITWLELKTVPDSVSPKLLAPERVRFEIDPQEIFREDTDQDTDKEGKCTCLNWFSLPWTPDPEHDFVKRSMR